jgi:hypothetical protein
MPARITYPYARLPSSRRQTTVPSRLDAAPTLAENARLATEAISPLETSGVAALDPTRPFALLLVGGRYVLWSAASPICTGPGSP